MNTSLALRGPNSFCTAISVYVLVCVWIYISVHLYLIKRIENWLPSNWSNFFQDSPYVPQLHRDLTTQLSSAPVSSPSICLGLGRKSHQASMSASTRAAVLPLCSNGFALAWEMEGGTTGLYFWQRISNTQHAPAKAADFNPAQFSSLSTQNVH